jgi:hypothetical protein
MFNHSKKYYYYLRLKSSITSGLSLNLLISGVRRIKAVIEGGDDVEVAGEMG